MHVAARQLAGDGVQPTGLGTAHVEARHQALCVLTGRSAADETGAGEGRLGVALQHRVLPQRQVAHHAHGVPVFRNARHAGLHHGARAARQRRAVQQDLSRVQVTLPAQHLGQRGLAVTGHAGDGQHLAAPHAQVHPVQQRPGAVAADGGVAQLAHHRV